MNITSAKTYARNGILDFKHLPTKLRRQAAESKYADAVELYAATGLTIRRVAERCGVTASGLSAHIGKHHRDLLFKRYGLDTNDKDLYAIKVKPPRGQSIRTHLKYKEAIEACGDLAYIEYNVSQVGRLFNVNGSALAAQMRVHYPDIIPNREKLRQRLGIADNSQRGPRPWCVKAYTPALAMYRDTDFSIQEVADKCNTRPYQTLSKIDNLQCFPNKLIWENIGNNQLESRVVSQLFRVYTPEIPKVHKEDLKITITVRFSETKTETYEMSLNGYNDKLFFEGEDIIRNHIYRISVKGATETTRAGSSEFTPSFETSVL